MFDIQGDDSCIDATSDLCAGETGAYMAKYHIVYKINGELDPDSNAYTILSGIRRAQRILRVANAEYRRALDAIIRDLNRVLYAMSLDAVALERYRCYR